MDSLVLGCGQRMWSWENHWRHSAGEIWTDVPASRR